MSARLFAVALAGVSLFASAARAEDWRMISLHENGSQVRGLDVETITVSDDGVGRAAVITVLRDLRQLSYGAPVRYAISRDEFDCPRGLARFTEMSFYSEAGALVGSTRSGMDFEPVEPTSAHGLMLSAVCTRSAPEPAYASQLDFARDALARMAAD